MVQGTDTLVNCIPRSPGAPSVLSCSRSNPEVLLEGSPLSSTPASSKAAHTTPKSASSPPTHKPTIRTLSCESGQGLRNWFPQLPSPLCSLFSTRRPKISPPMARNAVGRSELCTVACEVPRTRPGHTSYLTACHHPGSNRPASSPPCSPPTSRPGSPHLRTLG